MLQSWLSHRPVQLLTSSLPLFTLSYTRGIRTAATPKHLRHRINSPGIGAAQFILKRKETARRVKVNRLLLNVNKRLFRGEWKDAWECLYRRMELPAMADSKTRFDAYEHAVTLFSSYERFGEATQIQTIMMNEGFIPSFSLRTRMACIAVLTKGAGEEDLLQLLQNTLADAELTELSLYQLIRFLGDTIGFSPSTIDDIVQTWITHHGQISEWKTLSYLIRIHVKRGQQEDAKAWLQYSIEQGTTSPALFTDFMAGLVRREHTDELTATIAKMQEAGVAPDLAVFNTIIYGHIKRGHFRDAVAAYNLLFSSRGKRLTPDKYTFTNMFSMCYKAREPGYQVHSVKRAQLPSPRRLYNNLIECHLIRTGGRLRGQSEALTTSVLNSALKLFMQIQDYEAAHTLLQTFDLCEVPADSTTVLIVLRPVLAIIWKERRKASKTDTWLRILLGSGWYENIEAHGTLFSLTGSDILKRLWFVGQCDPATDFQTRYTKLKSHANSKARRVISGKTDKLWTNDVKVLKNIVMRLFFAGAHRRYFNPSNPTTLIWTRRVLKAREVMIPNGEAMREYFASGKAGRKLRLLSEPRGDSDKRDRCDLRYLDGGFVSDIESRKRRLLRPPVRELAYENLVDLPSPHALGNSRRPTGTRIATP